jgi:hypothetical protein
MITRRFALGMLGTFLYDGAPLTIRPICAVIRRSNTALQIRPYDLLSCSMILALVANSAAANRQNSRLSTARAFLLRDLSSERGGGKTRVRRGANYGPSCLALTKASARALHLDRCWDNKVLDLISEKISPPNANTKYS